MKSGYTKFVLVVLVCVYFAYYVSTYEAWHFIDYANLIFHEAGHTIFFFTGQFLKILAGSAFQVLLPFGVAAYFFVHRQMISSAICIMWTGQNLLNVSIYASDAARMQMQLLGGDSVIHDWNHILGKLNLLSHADAVGGAISGLGLFCICVGAFWALYGSWVDAKGDSVTT